MNLKNDLYLSVARNVPDDYLILMLVKKQTWDTSEMKDDPDELSDVAYDFTLEGYVFEVTGQNGEDCIDSIEREDGEEVDGQQLIEDLTAAGYTVNQEIAEHFQDETSGEFEPV